MGIVSPTVLIVDDHEVFRTSARALLQAERLAEAPDPPVVVVVSGREATTYGPRLRQAPVRGFISKSELSGRALAALVGLTARCSAGS